MIEYRMMKITEINEVANLYGAMARELNLPGLPGDESAVERWTVSAFQSLCGPYRAVIFVAARIGEIVGFIQGGVLPDMGRGGMTGQVLSMYVEPEFRGRWVAIRLMKAMETWGREAGMGAAEVHAKPGNEGFYKRFGFKPVHLKMSREY